MTQKQNLPKQINEIKDRIYEAEGLLELLQLRPEKLDELAPIILRRVDEAREMVAGLTEPEKSASTVDSPGIGIGIANAETPKEESTAIESVKAEIADEAEIADVAPVDDEDIVSEYSVEEEESDAEEDEPKVVEEAPESREEIPGVREEIPGVREATPEPREEAPKLREASQNAPKSKGPAFCLNDRYRFRRTIFGGSDAEFNDTMDLVAGFSGLAEAEDFFYTDMGLNRDDEDVKDFMEIISNYFAK